MDDKIVAAVFGALFGFALPYLAGAWERARRARRMVAALDRELAEVTVEIEKKLAWVGRDVAEHLHEVDPDRCVEANGVYFYLGEREKFTVPRAYWKAKYTEIAEAISDRDFADFYVMYRLVDRIEQKFREMKSSFESSPGRKDVMALACFKDLVLLSKDLRGRLRTRTSARA